MSGETGGTVYIALYDFEGGEGQLSFKKDDEILIIPSGDATDDWLLGTIGGSNPGWVPSNYVQKMDEFMNSTGLHNFSQISEKITAENETPENAIEVEPANIVEAQENPEETANKEDEETKQLEAEVERLKGVYLELLKTNQSLQNSVTELQGEKDMIMEKLDIDEDKMQEKTMEKILLILQELHAGVMQKSQDIISEARGNSWQEVQGSFFKEGWKAAIESSRHTKSNISRSNVSSVVKKDVQNKEGNEETVKCINVEDELEESNK